MWLKETLERRDSVWQATGVRWQRNRKFDSAIIVCDPWVAQRPELAASDRVGQREGVSAKHIDVVEAERRQPCHVLVAHVVALGAEPVQRCVHVDRVPENDDVHNQAERAELVLLAFAIALPQLTALTVEHDARELVTASPRLSCTRMRRRYAPSSMNRSR